MTRMIRPKKLLVGLELVSTAESIKMISSSESGNLASTIKPKWKLSKLKSVEGDKFPAPSVGSTEQEVEVDKAIKEEIQNYESAGSDNLEVVAYKAIEEEPMPIQVSIPKVQLQSHGGRCFINSVLQALIHNRVVFNFITNDCSRQTDEIKKIAETRSKDTPIQWKELHKTNPALKREFQHNAILDVFRKMADVEYDRKVLDTLSISELPEILGFKKVRDGDAMEVFENLHPLLNGFSNLFSFTLQDESIKVEYQQDHITVDPRNLNLQKVLQNFHNTKGESRSGSPSILVVRIARSDWNPKTEQMERLSDSVNIPMKFTMSDDQTDYALTSMVRHFQQEKITHYSTVARDNPDSNDWRLYDDRLVEEPGVALAAPDNTIFLPNFEYWNGNRSQLVDSQKESSILFYTKV